jgi:hypothetical protein
MIDGVLSSGIAVALDDCATFDNTIIAVIDVAAVLIVIFVAQNDYTVCARTTVIDAIPTVDALIGSCVFLLC